MIRLLRRFLARRQNLGALAIILFYVVIALAAPRLAPQPNPANPSPFREVDTGSFQNVPKPPSTDAPLGTTPNRWDIYFTLVWGTRSALYFGLIVTLTTATLGVLLGAASGYAGGWVNGVIMRVTDAFLTFPLIAGVWVLAQLVRNTNPFPFVEETPTIQLGLLLEQLHLSPLMLAFILFSWMPYARLINTNVMHLKRVEFIQAARAQGMSSTRIILRHLLPNSLAPAIVLAARDIGGVVILAAAFTFIGAGDGPEWGTLLVVSRNWIVGAGGNPLLYWWVFLPATLALTGFSIGWNLLGDGLNALLDPRTAGDRV